MARLVWVLVAAVVVIPFISGEMVRTKRQATLDCDEETETEIVTSFLFTENKTCPQLIGGIPDWYNEDFRAECASWLNLDSTPDEVSNTYVSECYQYPNDTVKYRTKICCYGKPNVPSEDQLMCFTCSAEYPQYEPHIGYYHTQHCNHYAHNATGPEVCAAGEVCAVEFQFNSTYRNGLVTKSCMPRNDCAALEGNNSNTCRNRAEPSCAYCYNTIYGNYDHPFPRPKIYGPCYPNPCYNRGSIGCRSNGTEVGDPYECICRPGYSGPTCSTAAPCVVNPCQNGGRCNVTGSDTNDYECICRPRVSGRHCTIVPPCYRNPCYNRGQCQPTGNSTSDYQCLCHPAYFGRRCERNFCHNRPCQQGGICVVKHSAPYYFCRCHLAWIGYDCNDTAPYCPSNWCENGGTCYIQDGPDERCLCPVGFVGKRCEHTRPHNCGEESGLRSYFRRVDRTSDSLDCTTLNNYYSRTSTNSLISVSKCSNLLRSRFGRPAYIPGINGDRIYHNEAMVLSHCEQGRDYTWATAQVCCASCGSNPCQNGGWCMQEQDSFTCQCRFNYAGRFCEKKLSSCFVAGDPHYYTFDGPRLNYQGACKYTLTESSPVDGLPYFRVTNKNEHRQGSPDTVSYPQYVEIEVYNVTVRITKDTKAYVDGALLPELDLPFRDAQKRYSVERNGLKLRLQTDFGLVVEFTLDWVISVRVPEDAAGHVAGMCGDFNGDADDDYVLPDGTDVTNRPNRDLAIGNFFQIEDPEDSRCPSVKEDLSCDAASVEVYKTKFCGPISDTSGPFRQCLRKAPDETVTNFLDDCVYDVCAFQTATEAEKKKAACGALAAFAERCMSDFSPANLDWRITTGCVPECEGNQVYKPLTASCRITCDRPDPAKCTQWDTESCGCEDTDVVLPNNTCVHASVCGCVDEGREIEEVWCNDDFSVRSECVTCTECPRPLGKVVTSTVTDRETQCPDPCQGVVCEHGGECVTDWSRASGYQCQCCPKWGGQHCEEVKRYTRDNSPCKNVFIRDRHCPGGWNVYFAHEDPQKFIQCSYYGEQTYEMSCPYILVFDNEHSVCNWPWVVGQT